MIWTTGIAEEVREQDFRNVPDEIGHDEALIEACQFLADAGFIDNDIIYMVDKGLITSPLYDPSKPFICQRHHPEVL